MSRSSAAARVRQLAVLLEHHAPLQEVGARVDQHALGLEPVAAGAARFLLIVLERLRRARVDDEAHVRPVDAHPERHRRHDDVELSFRNASWLRCRSSSAMPGVIRPRAPAGVLQPLRQRVHFLARRAVDDAGLAAMPLEHVEDLLLQRASARARGRRGSADRTSRPARSRRAGRAATTMSRRTRAVAVAV